MATEKILILVKEDGSRVVKRNIEDIGNGAKKAAAAVEFLKGALGALAGGLVIQQLVEMTNIWTDLNSRIRIATGSIQAGTAVMSRLQDMARRTYSSLELTAESFLGNARAMKDLGYSTNETLDFVEAINNALVVSGAKGERAESVMNALTKSMALGKLSGDQLETVLSSGGRITEALADSLGVTTLELRKMGTEGKLTGDVIYEAMVGALEDLRAEADSMPATIGDAFVLLRNSVLGAVGSFDELTGASSAVASAIIWVADNLAMFTPILAGVAAAIATALIPVLWAATAATWAFTAALLANPLTWVAIAVGLVVAAAVLLIQRMGGVQEAFLTVQTVALDVWERIKAGGQSLSDVMQGVALFIQSAFTRAFAVIAEKFAGLVASMGAGAGWLGLDAAGASDFAVGLHKQAAAQEAGSQIAFNNAAANWGRATGAGPQMDNIGVGASWSGLQDLNTVPNLDNGTGITPPGLGGGGAGGGKLSDALQRQKDLLEQIKGPMDDYEKDLTALDALLDKGSISVEDYNEAFRDLRIEFLDTQTTLESGMERAFLKIAKDAEDAASQIENLIDNAFSAATDALVDFVKTGKLDFSSLIDGMISDLLRLVLQQQIIAPLANALSGLGGGMGSFFSGLFGAATGGTMSVGEGGLGFATGGSMTVPGSGGVDSVPVSFMASPGEKVKVTRPGEVDRGAQKITQNVQVNVIGGGDNTEVEERKGADGSRIIDVVVNRSRSATANDIAQGGSDINRALETRYGLNPAAGNRT